METSSAFAGWLRRHRVACFGLMVLSFIAFGLLTLDLVRVVDANANFLWQHGREGLLDGGLRQLLGLLVTSIAAMAAWLLFKLCETLLLQALSR
ncbi:MAG: hypothetical protein V3V71_05225 [Roseateles sp.]|jgi:hypothetical protein|uniref:hypothetical protein n=1 Tax=Roseateles sp. TaxID=1971397 RepID=UPI000F9F3AF3|nr:hypothetical protein [Methylibium sp.]MBY0366496.1 hypothetical protein [Burkholderiaceae bacterium]RTL21865.1 MAG: hypothetical protein EKK52_07490 [Burkholderiales bacterium]|mmetsp:Transcript_35336/g.55354  ORF Transcript_35336/g.55354 Transcript_35336/m.55354 type:complete len:94 (+) Transcript_35336:2-283(+)